MGVSDGRTGQGEGRYIVGMRDGGVRERERQEGERGRINV